jgi:hypothetical protein
MAVHPDVEALLRIVPSEHRGEERIDWAAAEAALGTKLPSDYASLLDTCGVGDIEELVILPPLPVDVPDLQDCHIGSMSTGTASVVGGRGRCVRRFRRPRVRPAVGKRLQRQRDGLAHDRRRPRQVARRGVASPDSLRRLPLGALRLRHGQIPHAHDARRVRRMPARRRVALGTSRALRELARAAPPTRCRAGPLDQRTRPLRRDVPHLR